MLDRDMLQMGYCQNMPGSYMYGNYNFQGPPGSLMPMQNNMINNPYIEYGQNNINPLMDINTRINNLENRIKLLEQKINTQNNQYQDDNSMYML